MISTVREWLHRVVNGPSRLPLIGQLPDPQETLTALVGGLRVAKTSYYLLTDPREPDILHILVRGRLDAV